MFTLAEAAEESIRTSRKQQDGVNQIFQMMDLPAADPKSETRVAQLVQPTLVIRPSLRSKVELPAYTISNNGTVARVVPAVPVATMKKPLLPVPPALPAHQRQVISASFNVPNLIQPQQPQKSQHASRAMTPLSWWPKSYAHVQNAPPSAAPPSDALCHKRRTGWRMCSTCANCLKSNCGICANCLDKPKFGGPGKRKRLCTQRRCLAPIIQTDDEQPTDGKLDQPWLVRRHCGPLRVDTKVEGGRVRLSVSFVGHGKQMSRPRRGKGLGEQSKRRTRVTAAAAPESVASSSSVAGTSLQQVKANSQTTRASGSGCSGVAGKSVTERVRRKQRVSVSSRAERAHSDVGLQQVAEHLLRQGIDPKVLRDWTVRRIERSMIRPAGTTFVRRSDACYYSPLGRCFRSRSGVADFILYGVIPSGRSRDGPRMDINDDDEEDGRAWVQCDECQKWRELSLAQATGLADGDSWMCALNSDARYNLCEVPEDPRAWEVDHDEGSGEKSEEEEVVMIDEDEVCDGATGVYIRAPRGRVPVGKEWDTSTGEWVPAGQSKGATWVKYREVGHCNPKPGHELGGKRGGRVVLDQRQKRRRCSETEHDEDMVMVDEDENNEAEEEVVEEEEAARMLRNALPPGWRKARKHRRVRLSSRGLGYRGPAGEHANTINEAWEMHAAKPAGEEDDEEDEVMIVDEDEVVVVDDDEDGEDDDEEPREAATEMIELDEPQVAIEGESDAESEDEPPAPLATAAEPMSADEANALVGRRIRVWWEGDCKWFRGRIQAYNALWQTHIVLYDDNDRRSYRMNEVRWELEGTAGVEVMEEWEALELRCAISFLPLTDPAKGSSCAHVSRCNFDMLWQHVSRHHACPMAGCDAPMRRTRDVVRDDALRAKLEALPDGTQTIWRRGDEIRSTQPEPAHVSAAQPQPQPQPQRRPARTGTSASTAPVPSSRAGCKERVVVVKKERR